jgi:starch synthase
VGPYLRHVLRGDPTFFGIKLITTIHNLGYQGIFAPAQLAEVGLGRELFNPSFLEFYGDINFLKGGIVYADAITTVSPRYAQEIQTPEYGFRLDGLLRSRRDRLFGILNGVDYAEWNPEADPHIAARYSDRDLSGKRACKLALLEEMGLPAGNIERPLIGIVSRFANQKGFDLIADVSEALAREDVSFAILGSGEPRFEEMFRYFSQARPDKFGARIGYDDDLAHRIEAGADIFLMPSRYEPCGLNQIYSLRYGTVPVVRATGGLDDTIDESTGFKFSEYSGEALLNTVRTALAAYQDREAWCRMMVNGMQKDYSWDASAGTYSGLYKYLISA